MTIKRYLFLLFSTLILTIAITQVVLLYIFKANIDHEINKRSRDFADMIVEFAVENLDQSEQTSDHKGKNEDVIFVRSESDLKRQYKQHKDLEFIVIEVERENDKHKTETAFDVPLNILRHEGELKKAIVDLPKGAQSLVLELSREFNDRHARRIRGKNEEFEVKIYQPRSSQRHIVKKRLKHQIDKFRADKRLVTESKITDNGVIQRKKSWLSHYSERHREGLINKMFNAIFAVILFTTTLALLMVFWLSRKFSEPLQQLSQAFKRLEQGEFGVKVQPRGVQELKQTINRFNAMSEQLVKLAEAEHKLLQQTHLMELSDVSKGIAHALRNPIHTIGLAIEQLSQDDLPASLRQKLLDKVQSKIAQLDKNIAALLTVTSGEIDRNAQVNLVTVIQDVQLELKQSHQLQNSELSVQLQVPEDLIISGSEKELRSVLHTLIFNAYEAGVEANTGKIDIQIIAKKTANSLKITISDNGCGIEDEIMAHMFDPHNSSKAEGAGMGLYISKRIIELYYEGRLTIANSSDAPGVTAEVKFNIPASEQENEPELINQKPNNQKKD